MRCQKPFFLVYFSVEFYAQSFYPQKIRIVNDELMEICSKLNLGSKCESEVRNFKMKQSKEILKNSKRGHLVEKLYHNIISTETNFLSEQKLSSDIEIV